MALKEIHISIENFVFHLHHFPSPIINHYSIGSLSPE